MELFLLSRDHENRAKRPWLACARGLPGGGVGWADLLDEAIVRVLSGSRRWPPGVPILAFLAWTMRSICDEHWRRVQRERRILIAADADDEDPSLRQADQSPAADPERLLAATQALAALDRLFAEDVIIMKIIAGMADGLSATEIRRLHGLTETEYDTARKRMRRALLRHGLRGSG